MIFLQVYIYITLKNLLHTTMKDSRSVTSLYRTHVTWALPRIKEGATKCPSHHRLSIPQPTSFPLTLDTWILFSPLLFSSLPFCHSIRMEWLEFGLGGLTSKAPSRILAPASSLRAWPFVYNTIPLWPPSLLYPLAHQYSPACGGLHGVRVSAPWTNIWTWGSNLRIRLPCAPTSFKSSPVDYGVFPRWLDHFSIYNIYSLHAFYVTQSSNTALSFPLTGDQDAPRWTPGQPGGR